MSSTCRQLNDLTLHNSDSSNHEQDFVLNSDDVASLRTLDSKHVITDTQHKGKIVDNEFMNTCTHNNYNKLVHLKTMTDMSHKTDSNRNFEYDAQTVADDDQLVSLCNNCQINPKIQSTDVQTHLRSPTQTSSQLFSLIESSSQEDFKQGNNSHCTNDMPNKSVSNAFIKTYVPMNSSANVFEDVSTLTDSDLLHQLDSSQVPQDCLNNSKPPQVSYISGIDSGAASHLKDLPISSYPDWKLDRRESGHLFWRRDSSTLNGVDPSSRVKFRYEVEVCEFESRNSEVEDLAEEDDDAFENEEESEEDSGLLSSNTKKVERIKDEQLSLVSTRIVFIIIAITAIIVAIIYHWLLNLFSPF